MGQPAAIDTTSQGVKRCATCRIVKAADQFSGTSCYCRPCRNAYDRAVREQSRLADQAAMEVKTTYRPAPRPDASLREHLETVLGAIFEAAGFSGMELEVQSARERLAARERAKIEAEGWIV